MIELAEALGSKQNFGKVFTVDSRLNFSKVLPE
jgi:hypothetical protein